MNKNSLLAALLVTLAVTGHAQSPAPTAPTLAPAREAAAPQRTPTPAPQVSRSRGALPDRPVAVPRLELHAPSGSDVICACVRTGARA
jgi:hypothetical protein